MVCVQHRLYGITTSRPDQCGTTSCVHSAAEADMTSRSWPTAARLDHLVKSERDETREACYDRPIMAGHGHVQLQIAHMVCTMAALIPIEPIRPRILES